MIRERTESVRTQERRQYRRYAEANRVLFLEVGESGKAHAGHLRDLSAGGLCLVTSRRVSLGSRLCLGIFFEHRKKNPLIVLARVRRCSPEEGEFVLGLEFVRSTDAQRDALEVIQQYLIEQYGG
jgi:hypothetical protein